MDKFLDLIKEAAIEFEKDYKVEWERVRLEKLKLEEDKESKKETLNSEGEPVPFITEISASQALNAIYIKHPGDEDEESDEEMQGTERDENEEESFTQFVQKHKEKINEKMQTN